MGKCSFKALLATGVAVFFVHAGPALAQGIGISMPEQSLFDTLKLIAQRTGVNILFTPDSVTGVRAPALSGTMNALQAVNSVIQGTDLEAISDGSGGLIVRRRLRPPPLDPTYIEQVIVTSTRIVRDGFSAPTPTTVLDGRDLSRSAQPSAFDAVNRLPVFAGSISTLSFGGGASTGNVGLSALNLRGLGTNRTLVLLDGQRLPGSNLTGITDISELPDILVQRIEIVTGGASASWGSDAVSGVVNFILDKKFDGIKANLEGGLTSFGDDANSLIQLAAGTDIARGRGHIEGGIQFSTESGVRRPSTRPWYNATKVIQQGISSTPPGTPEYINSAHVYETQVAGGGIITGQGTALSASVVGTSFGPGGVPMPFQFGTFVNGLYMIGGDSSSDFGNSVDLGTSLTRGNFYTRLSYDPSPGTEIYVTALYSAVQTKNVALYGVYKPANLTIQCDNAFLPSQIGAACGGAGHAVQFGSGNSFMPNTVVNNLRSIRRYTMGGDGVVNTFGTDWSWSVYAEHGESDFNVRDSGETLTNLYNLAIDAVRAPNGQIVCRQAAAQAAGCVPLDIIGTNVANPAAIDWVTGTAFRITNARQEAVSFNIGGEPFSDWAGPISIASGFEYRQEGFTNPAVDPYSVGNGGNSLLSATGNNWFTGNFHGAQGNYHVSEGFVESVVPLLKDGTWGVADLDLGGRATGYSTAGYVSTWKVGLTFGPAALPGLKLRAMQSRDVRAPNLSELFAAATINTQTVIEDFAPRAGQTFTVAVPTLGNIKLTPEKAATSEIGISYQPAWLSGFSISVDYYRIALKQAIGALTAQQELDLCFLGNQVQCGNTVRDAGGVITQITVQSINLTSTTTDGLDIEANYRAQLGDIVPGVPGSLILRAFATDVSKFIVNSGVTGQPLAELAGENSTQSGTTNPPGTIPHWRILGEQSYDNTLFGLDLAERWISPGQINRAYVQCSPACPAPTVNNPTINNNVVKSALYFDLGGQYNFTPPASGQLQGYFRIDNLMNAAPPASPSISGPGAIIGNGVNQSLYDVVGRMYRVGIRFSN